MFGAMNSLVGRGGGSSAEEGVVMMGNMNFLVGVVRGGSNPCNDWNKGGSCKTDKTKD